MSFLKPLWIVSILLLVSHLTAQDNSNNHLNVDNGLSQNSVNTIFQDSKGFFWISTADGINKYDGFNCTVFKNNPLDKYSIASNSIALIDEDQFGQIWITHNKGISIYNPQLNQFKNISFLRNNYSVLNQNPILGNDKNGNMWIWLAEHGLKCFDKNGKNYNYKNAQNINAVLGNSKCYDGFVVNNELFLLRDDGLFILNLKTFEFAINVNLNKLYSYQKLDKETYLFGSESNVYLYNLNSHVITAIKTVVAPTSINFMAKIDANAYIIGSKYEEQLYKLNLSSKTITPQTLYNCANNEKHIECIWIDKSKNLWIGSNFNGITKCNYPLKTIHSINNSSAFNLVKAITSDHKGNLYVANYDYGIDIYNKDKVKIKTLKQCKTTLALIDFNTKYILGYDLGMDGIYLINKSTYTIKKFSTETSYTGKTSSFPQFTQDQHYVYYVYDNSIFKLEKTENAKPVFVCKINAERTGTICLNHNSEILIGGNGYIEIYNPKTKAYRIKKITANTAVKCIYEKENLYYYIGTSNGLFIYNLNWTLIASFNAANGLANAFIYGILEDEQKQVWLSTNNGIFKFYPKTQSFFHITKEDGLISTEFNSGAYFKSTDNLLYFGGINGLNYFSASEIQENKTDAKGMITQFSVNDKVYSYNGAILLNPNENTIAFEFASDEYTNSKLNEYQYYVEGIDKNWIKSQTKRFTRYPNLPHGKYIFKLKCSNNEGYYGTQVLEFPFEIKAPFYKTWWFIGLMVLIIIGVILSVFYLIYKRKIGKQEQLMALEKQLQKQRMRFSRDLHDNIGSRTSLLIKNLESLKNEESKAQINKLQDNASDILQNLRETVWALNEGSISIESLADKITQFAQNRLPIDTLLKLNIQQKIEEDKQMNGEDFLNIYRICQEAINNAIKYSGASNLDVLFEFDLKQLLNIVIQDNGKGFDLNFNSIQHYGIQNMKNRAIESHLTFEIDVENGTCIRLQKQF